MRSLPFCLLSLLLLCPALAHAQGNAELRAILEVEFPEILLSGEMEPTPESLAGEYRETVFRCETPAGYEPSPGHFPYGLNIYPDYREEMVLSSTTIERFWKLEGDEYCVYHEGSEERAICRPLLRTQKSLVLLQTRLDSVKCVAVFQKPQNPIEDTRSLETILESDYPDLLGSKVLELTEENVAGLYKRTHQYCPTDLAPYDLVEDDPLITTDTYFYFKPGGSAYVKQRSTESFEWKLSEGQFCDLRSNPFYETEPDCYDALVTPKHLFYLVPEVDQWKTCVVVLEKMGSPDIRTALGGEYEDLEPISEKALRGKTFELIDARQYKILYDWKPTDASMRRITFHKNGTLEWVEKDSGDRKTASWAVGRTGRLELTETGDEGVAALEAMMTNTHLFIMIEDEGEYALFTFQQVDR